MTTKLEVLNHVLNVVGESPVSDPESDHPTVMSAMTQINRVLKEMQTRGWWFNTEFGLNLIPNEQGHVIIPSDTLYVDPVDAKSRLVRRGGKLYDPVNHTFKLDRPVPVNAVLLLPIEDLPESAAMYVMHKSAYDFYVNDDGDETKANRLEAQVDRSWALLQSEEMQVMNVNALMRPSVQFLRYRMKQQGTQYNPRYPGGRA